MKKNGFPDFIGMIGTGLFAGIVVAVNLGDGFKPPSVWYLLFASVIMMAVSAHYSNKNDQ